LPSSKIPSNPTKTTGKRKAKKTPLTNTAFGEDDTPKAFARLMEFTRTGKGVKGLDDGIKKAKQPNKKRKRGAEAGRIAEEQGADAAEVTAKPTILPGERLGEFAARVDRALPLTGLVGKGADGRKTKTERKMQRMQAQWREEETQRKEKREELDEELAEHEADSGIASSSKRKKSAKSKGDDSDDDIWAKVEPRRLNDIVHAPPVLTIPKVRGATVQVEDVPRKAGSLRKREELGQERSSILEGYRKMMAGKRTGHLD
jgi:hypothetical protein